MKYILTLVPILGLFTGGAIAYSDIIPSIKDTDTQVIEVREQIQAIKPEVLSASTSAEVVPTPKPTLSPTSTPSPSPSPKILTDDEQKKICDEMVEKFKESKKGDLLKIDPELQAKKEEVKKKAQEELKNISCDQRTPECMGKIQSLNATIRNPGVDGDNENYMLSKLAEEINRFRQENCK